MQLNPVASTVLVLVYIFTSVAIIVILGIFLYLLKKVQAQLESLEAKINPLLIKAEEVLSVSNEKIATLGDRTESILVHGESVAENLHEKVDRTAATVQQTINAPIIRLNSIAAGVAHGIQTFSSLQRKRARKGASVELSQRGMTSPEAESMRSPEFSTSSVIDTSKNSNGAPVALRARRE